MSWVKGPNLAQMDPKITQEPWVNTNYITDMIVEIDPGVGDFILELYHNRTLFYSWDFDTEDELREKHNEIMQGRVKNERLVSKQ